MFPKSVVRCDVQGSETQHRIGPDGVRLPTRTVPRKRWPGCLAVVHHQFCFLAVTAALATNCRVSARHTERVETGTFAEFFRLAPPATLQEAPDDLLGDIAVFVEARNGDLLIGDEIMSQVRRYSPTGSLIAQFGAYGEGPFEFRRIGGLLEDADGRVVITDPRLARITILTPNLQADTLFLSSPVPRGLVLLMGNARLLLSASGPRASAFTLMDEDWQSVWTIPSPSPGTMQQYPYWNGYASTVATATPTTLVAAYSLRYPVYIYGMGGNLLDSLTSAPHSFRAAPVVKRGAFTGPGRFLRLDEWLASFDVMSRLAILNDSLLVVVHGVLRRTATSRAAGEDRRVDVYHLPSRSKLAEDVPLPDGSRVLGGGRGLYLLTAQPPEPWTIARAEFVGRPTNRGEARRGRVR